MDKVDDSFDTGVTGTAPSCDAVPCSPGVFEDIEDSKLSFSEMLQLTASTALLFAIARLLNHVANMIV